MVTRVFLSLHTITSGKTERSTFKRHFLRRYLCRGVAALTDFEIMAHIPAPIRVMRKHVIMCQAPLRVHEIAYSAYFTNAL